jgi:hypothetical protein
MVMSSSVGGVRGISRILCGVVVTVDCVLDYRGIFLRVISIDAA